MIPEAQKQQMAEAVAKIRETMAAAAKAAGRDPAEVRLCAACKTRTVEEVRYSADLPIDLFGENHVQELVEKTDANAYNGKPGHFIGHLQTNKVNKVVGRAALIQSVDSTRLLDKIDAAAARLGLVQDILVEINIGEEASKSGVDADSLFPLLEAAAAREHIRLRGLMAIPPADADDTETRRFFAQMRELLARADARHYDRAQMDPMVWGWGAHTPMEFYNIYHTAQNSSFAEYSPYSNEKVDEYMDQALASPSLEESYDLWKKAQWDGENGVTQEGDIPWIWLVNIDHLYWSRKGLHVADQKLHPHGHGWSIVNNVDQWTWE